MLIVGASVATALASALKVAPDVKPGVTVTVFSDAEGEYLTELFWNDE